MALTIGNNSRLGFNTLNFNFLVNVNLMYDTITGFLNVLKTVQ